jgi:hypothetical protein
MAPGGNGPGAPDGRADDADGAEVGLVALPLWSPDEQPTTTNKTAATTALTDGKWRLFLWASEKRTVSIYATLAGVMERLGFCECCRP